MFYKVSRYNQLLESLNESFHIDQEIMIRTKNGWVYGIVKKISGNIINWSNSQGQMGSNNISDIRPLEARDLRSIYFKSNPKLSNFYIPFEVIKTTEKSLYLGYNNKGIWVPKKLINEVWPNKFDYNNTPRDGYNISMLVYYDDDKQKFFDDYAMYIHSQVKNANDIKYKAYLKANRQLLDDVIRVVNYFYKMVGAEYKPSVDLINYDTYTFNIDDNWQLDCGKYGSIRSITAKIDETTFKMTPENVKEDTLERRMFLAALSTHIKLETSETFKSILEDELEILEKQKDTNSDYSDDSRIYKSEQNRLETANKIKAFLQSLNK